MTQLEKQQQTNDAKKELRQYYAFLGVKYGLPFKGINDSRLTNTEAAKLIKLQEDYTSLLTELIRGE